MFHTRILAKIFETFFDVENTFLWVIEGAELDFEPFGTILKLFVPMSFLALWTDSWLKCQFLEILENSDFVMPRTLG